MPLSQLRSDGSVSQPGLRPPNEEVIGGECIMKILPGATAHRVCVEEVCTLSKEGLGIHLPSEAPFLLWLLAP